MVSAQLPANIARNITFCTWELTRFIVLNHCQLNGDTFWRSKGDVFASSGSSYTGMRTKANLVGPHVVSDQRVEASRNVLCVVEYRSPFVQEIIYTKFDSILDNPPERAVVVIRNIVN